MANQQKGNISILWGAVKLKGLAESSVNYDIGERGDTLSASDAVVHIKRNKNAIVTAMTINVVKGTEGLDVILQQIQTDVNFPLVVNDAGVGFKGAMASANCTQVTVGDSTGDNTVEEYAFIFKGNMQIISM